MNTHPNIDVRCLESVRSAQKRFEDEGSLTQKQGPSAFIHKKWFILPQSPLARRIVTFNLIAIIALIAGVLYFNPSRDNLAYQRATGLATETKLIASLIETKISYMAERDDVHSALTINDRNNVQAAIQSLDILSGVQINIFTPQGELITSFNGTASTDNIPGLARENHKLFLTDTLDKIWKTAESFISSTPNVAPQVETFSTNDIENTIHTGTNIHLETMNGITSLSVVTPISLNEIPLGIVMITSARGELNDLLKREREQVIRLFFIGMFVSVALSLVLASTITNPISELAMAAESSHRKDARQMPASRVVIPDFTSRPDEIGRLSSAMRGMVKALYQRIESNEQFAADVAHEIKNPLASLSSAVGTLRIAKKEEQRNRLLEVIEHDVQRLDRLVTDISSASRLDSELVKEEEKPFDLTESVHKINQVLHNDALKKGVEYIEDLPESHLIVHGMENRLAQVFINLITNAISFCEDGDAIRVWVRAREDRVLIVVEDTGPGIPEGTQNKIFQRFYSERPEAQFGNNSGLGLSISKQIVEAHGGVIWAENIHPTEADSSSEPLGARFVVGLPI